MRLPLPKLSLSGAVCVAGAAALCAPLLASSYFPGLDLPQHALAVAAGDVSLELVEPQPLGWSYWTLYVLAGAVYWLGFSAGVALQVAIAAYVAAFAWAAARLARAFGAHPAVGLLAAPAAYSVVLSYGFLPFALGLPPALALWAYAREERPVAVAACGLLVSFTHPMAAALAALGAGAVLAARWRADARRRIAAVAGALAVGMLPAIVAALQASGADGSLPPLVREASLLERFTAAPRPSLAESLGEAPARLLHVAPAGARVWLVALLLAAAAAMLALAGRRRRDGFAAEALLVALVLVYVASPYSLEAPLVVAVQPRVLPLIWVVALVALRVSPEPTLPRAALLPPLVGAVAVAAAVLATLVPFAREARDFDRVSAWGESGARTLALVEQPPAPDDAPASPWRAFGAHLMAKRGGYVSHAFFASGGWLPLRRIPGAEPPRAPPPGQPRTFSWDTHSAGWDQFLIRDADPSDRFDYFGAHAADVELLHASGRWRLYRRR